MMSDDYLERVVAPRMAPLKVDLPEGRSGDWEVQRFEVRKDTIEYMRCKMDGRGVPAGWYTRLIQHGGSGLFMSDTPAEMNDARPLFWEAEGHVLITGLGLGMVPRALLTPNEFVTERVEKVTVVELSQDVINLVAPSLAHLPVDVVCADAYEWVPPKGTVFDWAWHDIWPDMGSDNIPEFGQMRNHYKRFMAAPGRQLVWGEPQARAQKRRYG